MYWHFVDVVWVFLVVVLYVGTAVFCTGSHRSSNNIRAVFGFSESRHWVEQT